MNIPRSQVVRSTELESSYIPLPYRREVLKRDSNSCRFCNESTEFICHDLVKCRGGTTVPDNLLTCCQGCRREKEEFTATEYLQVRLERIDINKEVIMLIKVTFPDAKRPPIEGEVDDYSVPQPNTKAFYVRSVGNGKRTLVFTEPGMVIEELGGREKGGER